MGQWIQERLFFSKHKAGWRMLYPSLRVASSTSAGGDSRGFEDYLSTSTIEKSIENQAKAFDGFLVNFGDKLEETLCLEMAGRRYYYCQGRMRESTHCFANRCFY